VIASMTWPQLALAHLHLRTATRVLVRVARFDASTFLKLERGIERVEWATWLSDDAVPDVRAACSRSALYHSDAVAERVLAWMPGGRTDGPSQRVVVRVDNDVATVSLDASGAPLYQRGYRTEAGAAPLRETLAAALVMWSGWDAKAPLLDPCCGSGTIAVEAAMWARRIPPGAQREFAWFRWPGAEGVDWPALVAAAQADVRAKGPVVQASDVDADVAGMAARTAERAGVNVEVTVADAAARALEPRRGPAGWVVTNPPYGRRSGGDLRALYEAVGRLAAPPWRLAVVGAQGSPTSAFSERWEDSLVLRNGGLAVRFLRR
jgi:23S rRNA G2445 N2-methylase RlmL